MLRLLLALCAVALVTVTAVEFSDDWLTFKQTFGKAYETASQETHRFQIFRENLKLIAASNAQANNFTLGLNQFSDLTTAEFVAQHTGSLKPAAAYGGVLDLGNHTWDGGELPASVDWTTKGAVTSVKNQDRPGHPCGACWAFSAIAAMEGAMQLATGNLTSLSEQQFMDCPSKLNIFMAGCQGGYVSGAFNFAKEHSICTDASYPYQAESGSCKSSTCTVGMAKGKLLGYKGLSLVPTVVGTTEKILMSAVAQQPVSVGIESDGQFQHYKTGVFAGDCGSMRLGRTNHDVLLVGYGYDPVGGVYWKLKNSWGPTWGDSGYIRIKRALGGGGRYGECHVLSQASYPVVSK